MGIEDNCIVCGKPDNGLKNPYKPTPDKEFICSSCIIKMMLNKDKE